MDGADGAQVETTGGEQGQQQGANFDGLMDHINSQFEDFGTRLDALASPAEEPAEEPDLFMEKYGHLFEEPGAETQQQEQAGDVLARQALQDLAARDQQREQQFQELMQRVGAQELNREADQLIEKYPELRDPTTAAAVVEQAAQTAQQLGMPQLASSAGFAELVYRASKADALAQSGVPAGGDEHVPLEGAGGAGSAPQDADVGQGILNAMGAGPLWGRGRR